MSRKGGLLESSRLREERALGEVALDLPASLLKNCSINEGSVIEDEEPMSTPNFG